MLHDAHIAKDMRLEDGAVIEAASIGREFNVVMQWLSYPGRRCGTANSDQFHFVSVA